MSCKYKRTGDPQNGDYAVYSRTEKYVTLLCKLNTIDSDDVYWIVEGSDEEPYFIVAQSELTDIMYFGD